MTEKETAVNNILQTLLPAMEADGGGVELLFVENGIVHVKFKGTCLHCPSIGMTLKFGITQTLQDNLPWVQEVIKH